MIIGFVTRAIALDIGDVAELSIAADNFLCKRYNGRGSNVRVSPPGNWRRRRRSPPRLVWAT